MTTARDIVPGAERDRDIDQCRREASDANHIVPPHGQRPHARGMAGQAGAGPTGASLFSVSGSLACTG